MLIKKVALTAFLSFTVFMASAQPKKAVVAKAVQPVKDSLVIPVSKADLGTFPYFRTLTNYYASDSVSTDLNRVYFFNGKTFFTVEGKVSRQNLTIKNSSGRHLSEFECIREFDKVIATLGGIKIYAGKLPAESLKAFAGNDIIELDSKSQIAPSAFYGLVEYVIKTPEKEVWVQLEPYSLASNFYTLLIVEKLTPLLVLNTNKINPFLDALEKTKKATARLAFEPDKATLLSESKDELLNLVGVFQAHPDWKLKLECNSAPVGKADYTLALTDKRASAVKQALLDLGVKNTSIEAVGVGDQKQLVPNETEQGRLTNTRIEISLL